MVLDIINRLFMCLQGIAFRAQVTELLQVVRCNEIEKKYLEIIRQAAADRRQGQCGGQPKPN